MVRDIFHSICSKIDIFESYRVALCSKMLLSLWEQDILYKNNIHMSKVIQGRVWSLLKHYPYYIKNDVPCLSLTACENGYIPVLEWMVYMHKRISGFAIDAAARSGQLDVVMWLQLNKPYTFTKHAIELAAENNHLAVVKHLHNTTFTTLHAHTIDAACKSGNLALVKWLDTMRPDECTARAMDNAAASGSLDVLEYLYTNRTERCTGTALENAARKQRLDIVKWLVSHGLSTEGHAMDHAAALGNLDILRYLYKKAHMKTTQRAVERAAFNGHYPAVKWLLEHGMPCNYLMAFVCACESNHYDIAGLIRHYMLSVRNLIP